MRAEEFIAKISKETKENLKFEELRRSIPLGADMSGKIVLAQKRVGATFLRHTCVTGGNRVECISYMLITLSCLYESDEANFIILSPRTQYAELLGLKNMDVLVPYVRSKEDLEMLKTGLCDLLNLYSSGGKYPHLYLVIDGLEELPECNVGGELKEYSELFSMLSRRSNIDIISGVDLLKSIFSGCPGAFIGIGNCLVTTRNDGKADVTYAGEDTNLSMPVLIDLPGGESVGETVQYFNGLFDQGIGVAGEEALPKTDTDE